MRAAGIALLTALGLVLLPFAAHAQDEGDTGSSGPTVITGTVIHDDTGDPIESATVALMKADADSATATGTISASDGTFELEHSTP